MNIHRTTFLVCVVLCLLYGGRSVVGQTTGTAIPAQTGNAVNDFASVIDPATRRILEERLIDLKRTADIEFAVVTVPTTGDLTAFDYTLRLAREWGIGPSGGEQKGLILLVAVNDRKYQIQPSRHLQGDLPDGLVGEIGRRMRDPFRRGDYSGGISTAVEAIIATLAEKRGFTLDGIDPRQAVPDSQPIRESRRGSGCSPCVVIFIVLFILLIIFSNRGRRGGGGGFGGGGGSGLMNALILGSLLNNVARGSSGSSGWGSSGGSSGGGGFGGFGGGGDFNGGGAGGEW